MEERSTSLLDNLELLIRSCIAGERQAQNRLYERFAPKLFVVCQRYASTRTEAEEVLQEGFIKIFTHLDQFKHEGSFEGWMRRIMVNCALQRYNAKGRSTPVVSMEENIHGGSEENDAHSRLGQKELMELIQQLPPAYRMVFNLYVFEGMKHREIAETLGISEGTSKSNLSDARAILQKEVMKRQGTALSKSKSL
jgi:RNA polymerase sigma factor (sigma-70 family)